MQGPGPPAAEHPAHHTAGRYQNALGLAITPTHHPKVPAHPPRLHPLPMGPSGSHWGRCSLAVAVAFKKSTQLGAKVSGFLLLKSSDPGSWRPGHLGGVRLPGALQGAPREVYVAA